MLDDDEWPALLLGNGLSIAINERFKYDRLICEARLSRSEAKIFDHLNTSNFEVVLRHLQSAQFICQELDHRTAARAIGRRQRKVRQSMVRTIRRVHPIWRDIGEDRLKQLGTELLTYKSVYTTSYDLVLYWAMNCYKQKVTDHFLSDGDGLPPDFIPTRPPLQGRTGFRWLHGGLHMYVVDGVTWKARADSDEGLTVLEQIENGPGLPNIVAEGDSRQKMQSILRSDYLTACYDALRLDEHSFDAHLESANIVVLGQSLADSDLHLAEALRDRGGKVAFGVHSVNDGERSRTVNRIAELAETSKWQSVVFFDSSTHPVMRAVAQQSSS